MYGAIVGDIVGSRFEFNNNRKKEFEFFSPECYFTDDTVMTVAIADALTRVDVNNCNDLGLIAERLMKIYGLEYPFCGYGGRFLQWLFGIIEGPYNSFGNGAAMRVSPCAWAGNSIEHVKELSRRVTEVTHNHPEGIKGAEAVALSIYLVGRKGQNKKDLQKYIEDNYYDLNFTIDEIRDSYMFNETCQETVPQAIKCFLEANSFEDAIRTAVSLGGDSDTVAAITGSIAGVYWGVPYNMKKNAQEIIGPEMTKVVERFIDKYEQ